jgi:hypothetical protein
VGKVAQTHTAEGLVDRGKSVQIIVVVAIVVVIFGQ